MAYKKYMLKMNINSDKFVPDLIKKILDDIESGNRMGDDEFLSLWESKGEILNIITESADRLNRKINFDTVSFVVNRNINFTNICNLNCKFCGYRRSKNSKDSFLLDYDEILEKIAEGKKIGIDEICVTGGINPELKPDYYFGLMSTIKESFPDIHIHAFSPQEIYELSKAMGKSYRSVIEKLVDSGLNSMPGTAAEILSPETRRYICPDKISTSTWTEIIKIAHNLGVKTSATILFGHIESPADILYHIKLIRDIQDETGGFTEFIPLPFISSKTPLKNKVQHSYTENFDTVFKFYAVLRLYLDNFKNIQTSWPKIGVNNAKKSLSCGINDFGGTLMEENITKSAGGGFGEYLPEKEIINIIKSAGKIPIRRDTIYNTDIYPYALNVK